MDHGWDEHQALASRSRAALLEVLATEGGPLGVEELSAAVGLHVNTTREHLDRLVAAGLVARAPERRTTRGRPRILYRRLEPVGERVKAALDEVLLSGYGAAMGSPAEGAAAAGRRAAATLVAEMPGETVDTEQAYRALVEELDRLGFAPVREHDAIRLHHCPVETMARARSEVVCAMHLGLTGAIAERTGRLEVVDAVPFVDGTTCVLRLREV